MKKVKIPRKIKKALKCKILKDADPAWKTSEVKIHAVSREKKYRRPMNDHRGIPRAAFTHKGLSVTGYSLSPR